MGKRFWSCLAGWFWLKVSLEVWVKMSAQVVVIWSLDWDWRIHFPDGSFTWLKSSSWSLSGGLSFSPCGSVCRAVWIFYGIWAACLPQKRWFKGERYKLHSLLEEGTHSAMTTIFCLLEMSYSVKTTLDERTLDPEGKRTSKYLWTCIKTIAMLLFYVNFCSLLQNLIPFYLTNRRGNVLMKCNKYSRMF